jgi:hypothetical protein
MINDQGQTPGQPTTDRSALWAAAPLLCVVHCLATPLLLVVAPVLAPSSRMEQGIMLVSLVLAGVLLARGVRVHRRLAVLAPAGVGALVWVGGELTGSHSLAVLLLHAAGGLLLAAGLAWNAWLRHEALCRECGCPAHEEATEPAGYGVPTPRSAA